MLYIILIVLLVIFFLYKQHRDKRLILFIQNHKLYTFSEQKIKKIESFSTNGTNNKHISKEELEKRVWCLRKFGSLNLKIIVLEDFKKRVDNIVELYKNKKHKEVENLMTAQNWNYFMTNSHVRWLNACDVEGVNMKMVHRFMEYHEKNNIFFNESMHDILVANEMKKNTLEQLYDIHNLVLNTVSVSTNMLDDIINMNGDVSESFKDWSIPYEC